MMRYTMAILLALATTGAISHAQDDSESNATDDDRVQALGERIAEAAAVVRSLEGVPQSALESAGCIAVVPSVKEGAFLIGYQYGRGIMSCREEAVSAQPPDTNSQGLGGARDFSAGTAWSRPSMVALDGASIGLQAGGTSTDIVALFMAPEAIESMLSGDIEFGVDAAVAAGREAAAETSDLEDGRNVVVYSRSDGLFAGVSLDGVSLRPDEDANEALYGTDIGARALLSDSDSSQIPADVSQFVQSLEAAAAGR